MHGKMKQRIDGNNRKLSEIEQRRPKLEQAAQSTVIPSDLHDRVRAALFHLIGMNGVAPAGWPAAAQKELAQFFFGTTVKSDPDRGVFVRLRQHAGLGCYWTYEARGLIGVGRGALSDYVYLHDVHDAVETKRALEPGEGAELARIATGLRDVPPPTRRGTLKCPARVYTHVLNRGGRGVVSPLDR